MPEPNRNKEINAMWINFKPLIGKKTAAKEYGAYCFSGKKFVIL